jgi:hypothetical protein
MTTEYAELRFETAMRAMTELIKNPRSFDYNDMSELADLSFHLADEMLKRKYK